MTVGQLIAQLQQFDADTEVTITDGFRCRVYQGEFVVTGREGEWVDIGVGGLDPEDD